MKQNKPKITPIVTLHDIFGQNLILNPRPSFANYGWHPKDPLLMDFLTGLLLTVAEEAKTKNSF